MTIRGLTRALRAKAQFPRKFPRRPPTAPDVERGGPDHARTAPHASPAPAGRFPVSCRP
jgi:hypothetical protein